MKTLTKQERRESAARDVQQAAKERDLDSMAGQDLLPYLACGDGRVEMAATDVLLQRGSDSVSVFLQGLAHPTGKIRATCALLLDHVADDRCIEPLLHAIRHDPLEAVRRCALHSLVCDGCKSCPLSTDVVAALIETAENDRSLAVRRRAVFYLSMQRPDPRAASFLKGLLAQTSDTALLRRAGNALPQHARDARCLSEL